MNYDLLGNTVTAWTKEVRDVVLSDTGAFDTVRGRTSAPRTLIAELQRQARSTVHRHTIEGEA